MKRFLAMLLVSGLILCSTPFSFADYAITDENYIRKEQGFISREEAVALFIRSIGMDTSNIDTKILRKFRDAEKISSSYTREIASAVSAGMITGYEDKTFRPQEKLSRVEAFVILNRILANRSLPTDVDLIFFDTPVWAEKEINRLASAGIVKGYGNGYMGAGDSLSREQTLLLADRAARLTGPTEDFYEYANQEWISSTEIPTGFSAWSDAHQISRNIMKETGEIIYSINRRKNKEGDVFPKGSSEQKIADVFAAGGNTVFRDSLGLKPAMEYLSLIDSVEDTKSLLSVMASLEQCGFHGLLPLSIEINALDSSKYILAFSECYTGMNIDLIHDGNAKNISAAYQNYLTDLFSLFGFDQAESRAGAVAALCVSLAESTMPLEEQRNIDSNYHILDESGIKKIFPSLNLLSYVKTLGFPDTKSLAFYDITLAQKINQVFETEDLELLKDYLRASVMDGSSLYLDSAAFAIWQKYQNTLSGTVTHASPADYAVQFVEEFLPWDLAFLYVERYASSTEKSKIEAMTREILDAYQNRVRVNTWMSNKSKTAALKKLENLQIRVGYPEDIQDYPDDGYQIRSIKEGGNLLEHRVTYCKRYYETGAELLKKGQPDNTRWNMVPQTVNAMYEPSTNSITIPIGILQPPFYQPSASRERNLGGIGSVIAHEISHALDDVGSRFDEKGNLNPWWQPEDEIAFSNICNDVEKAYSSIEPLPGVSINGKLTLSENIADLAGMSCLLDVAGSGNPRLEDLFLGYASIWRTKTTESYTRYLLQTDTHSPDKVRVNRVLSNFDAFQNFYGIRQGDGMFLPENAQIQIWNR